MKKVLYFLLVTSSMASFAQQPPKLPDSIPQPRAIIVAPKGGAQSTLTAPSFSQGLGTEQKTPERTGISVAKPASDLSRFNVKEQNANARMIVGWLQAVSKNCYLVPERKSVMDSVIRRYSAKVPADELPNYLKYTMEASLSIGVDIKNRGPEAGCEPANYFLDQVVDFAHDLRRAQYFATTCLLIYPSNSLKEVLNTFAPLEELADKERYEQEVKQNPINIGLACKAQEETNQTRRVLGGVASINFRTFNGPTTGSFSNQ